MIRVICDTNTFRIIVYFRKNINEEEEKWPASQFFR